MHRLALSISSSDSFTQHSSIASTTKFQPPPSPVPVVVPSTLDSSRSSRYRQIRQEETKDDGSSLITVGGLLDSQYYRHRIQRELHQAIKDSIIAERVLQKYARRQKPLTLIDIQKQRVAKRQWELSQAVLRRLAEEQELLIRFARKGDIRNGLKLNKKGLELHPRWQKALMEANQGDQSGLVEQTLTERTPDIKDFIQQQQVAFHDVKRKLKPLQQTSSYSTTRVRTVDSSLVGVVPENSMQRRQVCHPSKRQTQIEHIAPPPNIKRPRSIPREIMLGQGIRKSGHDDDSFMKDMMMIGLSKDGLSEFMNQQVWKLK